MKICLASCETKIYKTVRQATDTCSWMMRDFKVQKKAEKLSQCFGLHLPMKTTLFGKGVNINPKVMPVKD
jgi:hypothetical protein